MVLAVIAPVSSVRPWAVTHTPTLTAEALAAVRRVKIVDEVYVTEIGAVAVARTGRRA